MKLLRSVRFNVGLVLALALAASFGTFLPQLSDAPEKADLFVRTHPVWGSLFQRAGLFDVYHSWWFIALLALLAFDVVVCKLWKTPPDQGLVNLPPEMEKPGEDGGPSDLSKAIRLKPLHEAFEVSGSPDKAAAAARALIAAKGYRIHPSGGDPAARVSFVATRHRIQRWGSYIAHIALVVLLGGGLVKLVFGFEEMVPVLEGGAKEVQHKPGWQVRVDKFTVRYYEGTSDPKLFASDMTVLDGDRVLGSKKITVNDPLDIGGVRFYQASWGAGGMFRSATLDLGGTRLVVGQRTPTPLPGTPIRVYADVMLPNFTIAEDGSADTGSLDLKNPAVKVHFEMKGRRTRPIWLLLNAPDVAFAEDERGTLSHAPAPPFRLAAVDPILFSGIQVGYDPGYPFVIAGALAWLAGNVLLFYLHRRRVWVLAEPLGKGRSRLVLGGWSSRGAAGFRSEFEGIASHLRNQGHGGRE